MMMAFGFSVVFFSLATTLSFVEVTQYIAFATSRAYYAANETPAAQTDLANKKYQQLMQVPVFKKLFSLGWFTLSKPELGNFVDLYPTDSPDKAIFSGTRIQFNAQMLNLRVPFLGNTASDSSTGKATVNSYLGREVSTSECREQFNRARIQEILKLDPKYQPSSPPIAFVITDNGC
jgi:hypothetical protein